MMQQENPLAKLLQAQQPQTAMLAPFMQLAQIGAQLPQQLLSDSSAALQKQIQDLPNVARKNIEYFQQQLTEIPNNLRNVAQDITKGNQDLLKDGFPLKSLFPNLGAAPESSDQNKSSGKKESRMLY